MFLFFRKQIILFFLFFSTSVAANSTTPAWYLNQKQNDSQFFYGVGGASTAEDAKIAALNDLSQRIRVTISSTTSTESVAEDGGFTESTRQKIKTKVGSIDFSDYKVTNYYKDEENSVFYTEVQVDRVAFANQKKAEFDTMMSDLNDSFKFATAAKSKIDEYFKLQKVLEKATDARVMAQLLYAIDSGFPIKDYFAKFDLYPKTYKDVQSTIKIYIDSKDAGVAAVVSDAITQSGLNIVSEKSKSDSGLAIVTLGIKKSNAKVYNSFTSKNVLNLVIKDSSGASIVTKTFEFSGTSYYDADQAFNNSLKDLKDRVLAQKLF